MGTTESSERQSGLGRRLFVEHPRSLGMSWLEHGVGAFRAGSLLALTGCGGYGYSDSVPYVRAVGG